MNVDYNPYEGRTVTGSPAVVISNGQVIIDDGAFVGKKGAGRFLRRGRSQAPAGL
jgi:dihydropyrimidinase